MWKVSRLLSFRPSSPGKHADSPNTPDGLAPPCSHVHSHVIDMSSGSSGSIWPTGPIKLSVTCWSLMRNYTLSSLQMAELMVKYTYQAADGEQWVNMCLGCFRTSPLYSWGLNMCCYSEKQRSYCVRKSQFIKAEAISMLTCAPNKGLSGNRRQDGV